LLSRLIAFLRRVPAVKWAFARLRPARTVTADLALPAADASVAAADRAEMAACCVEAAISTEPAHAGISDAEPVVAETAGEPDAYDPGIDIAPPHDDDVDIAPVVAEAAVIDDIAQDAPVAPHDPGVGEASPDTREDVQPVAEDVAPATHLLVAVPPVEADEPSIETASVSDTCEPGIDGEPSHDDSVNFAPVVAEAAVSEDIAQHAPATALVSGDSDATSGTTKGAQPIAADAVATTADSAPVPPPESLTEEIRDRPKAPVKAADPVDRTALIRRRWAETGIRMWNPRLHGAGDAALNIQGCIELLPPAPGEMMPRYDKLEFRMLGGQIVCEGIIVEAPVLAGHRSFTRLAERRQTGRAREAEPA
jgi:hypothetical protein